MTCPGRAAPYTPGMIDEKHFDEVASVALKRLEKVTGDLDPDEVESNFTGDVLRLDFPDKTTYVINSHRAARQIWMAGERRAWHFDYQEETGKWTVRDGGDELFTTIGRLLGKRLGRVVAI